MIVRRHLRSRVPSPLYTLAETTRSDPLLLKRGGSGENGRRMVALIPAKSLSSVQGSPTHTTLQLEHSESSQ